MEIKKLFELVGLKTCRELSFNEPSKRLLDKLNPKEIEKMEKELDNINSACDNISAIWREGMRAEESLYIDECINYLEESIEQYKVQKILDINPQKIRGLISDQEKLLQHFYEQRPFVGNENSKFISRF